jgi:hypothetical protein
MTLPLSALAGWSMSKKVIFIASFRWGPVTPESSPGQELCISLFVLSSWR